MVFGYAFFNDPELPAVRLFRQAISEFAKNASELELQFEQNGSLLAADQKQGFSKILSLDYESVSPENSGNISDTSIQMVVSEYSVTLTFSDSEWPLAGQSIILVPFIPESSLNSDQLRWKCISGSVLIRLRLKDCRLGYGIASSDYRL